VVEAGCTKGAAEVVGEAFVVTEHDAFDDSLPLTTQPQRHGACEPAADGVGVPAKAAAPADDSPNPNVEDDVDPLMSKPRGLVEPVARSERLAHRRDGRQDRTLRGRASDRELEQNGLRQAHRSEPRHARRDSEGEAPVTSRPGDDDRRDVGVPGERRENASIERTEAIGTPPPPSGQQRGGHDGESQRRSCGRGRHHCGDGAARNPR
jgi:hypothetical protein